MSKGVNVVVIAAAPDAACAFCNKVAELRPYGPNGECICFECAMKDEETTRRQFAKLIEGTDVVVLGVRRSK